LVSQNLLIDPKKSMQRPHYCTQTAHKPQKNRRYERGYLGNYQR